MCVDITVRGTRLRICGVYIPPDRSQDVEVIEAHISSVSELRKKCSSDETIIVCGDYNQPRISWTDGPNGIQCASSSYLTSASAALIDGMDYLNFSQANLHHNHLGRVLDLAFCSSDQQLATDVCVSPLLPVDPHHPPLTLSIDVKHNNRAGQIPAPNRSTRLNYRRMNFAAFSDYFSNANWALVSECDNVDDMATVFCETVCQWLSANLPLVKKPVSPPWSNVRLRELKRERNYWQRKHRRWKTALTKGNFKRSSDAYRQLNAGLYKSYVMRVQTDLRRNPKGFWNFVNSKRKCSEIPLNVYLDEIESTTTEQSCELFAKFFVSVFSENMASDSEAESASADVPADLVDLSTFEITPDMILAATKKLKRSCCPGPDGIPALVFARCATAIVEPLCLIFNKSFEQAKFPAIWKQSFMFPVFKSGDRRNVRNYRGITSLSAASKIFELIVSNAILSRTKNYISFDQHGFMPGRSVSTNLLDFTSTCICHMEQKAQIDVIYTDLKAAFDRIDHRILLQKIKRLGASSKFAEWLGSYLRGRILRVQLDSCFSSEFTNYSGVPQGSNMGPLLFLLFFNDIALKLGVGCKLVYADDLKLYLVVRSVEDCRQLQGLLDMFVYWCRRNWLIISIAKCHVMTFHRTTNPIDFNYNIDSHVLERVDHVSDLGVLLDSKLTFNLHRSAIISKATRQLGFIAKVARDFDDPHCLKALYCSLVRPLIENACLVWCPYQLVWNLRIERVQKRFVRLALRNLPWRDPSNLPSYPDRCRLLGLQTLERRRKAQQAVFVAKVINGEIDAPNILSQLNFRASQRSLRSTGLLQPRFHRTSFGSHEPITDCIRTFSTVEDIFEFGEPSHVFMQRLYSSNSL